MRYFTQLTIRCLLVGALALIVTACNKQVAEAPGMSRSRSGRLDDSIDPCSLSFIKIDTPGSGA